jgi:hypothetical protein
VGQKSVQVKRVGVLDSPLMVRPMFDWRLSILIPRLLSILKCPEPREAEIKITSNLLITDDDVIGQERVLRNAQTGLNLESIKVRLVRG